MSPTHGVRVLDRRPVRDGIAKRHPELDDVRAACLHGEHEIDGRILGRVPASDERHKRRTSLLRRTRSAIGIYRKRAAHLGLFVCKRALEEFSHGRWGCSEPARSRFIFARRIIKSWSQKL
jgi:hypothetical protein